MKAALVLVAACWRNTPPPPPATQQREVARHPAPREVSDGELALEKMDSFAEKMCRCSDPRCAQDVADEMTKWAQEQSAKLSSNKLSEDDQRRAMAIGERMGRCMQQAMSGSAGP